MELLCEEVLPWWVVYDNFRLPSGMMCNSVTLNGN